MDASMRWAVLILSFLLCPLTVIAQEVEVPLDEAGRLHVIDPAMALRLELFPEHHDVQEVRLFQLEDGSYELVVQYRAAGQVLRERRTLSEDDVAELRRQVTHRLAATVPLERERQEDGRWTLLATTTLSGGLHGLLLPVALGMDDPETLASLPLLGMAAGFGVPFLLTRGQFVSEAHANMAAYGAVQGVAHGALLAWLAGGDDVPVETVAGAASLMGIGQTIAGYSIAKRLQFTPGQAEAVAYGGMFGFGYGFGMGVLLTAPTADEDPSRIVAGTMIAGSLAGTVAGHALASRSGMTIGDTRIMGLSGFLGLQAGGAGLALAGATDEHVQLYAGLLMAGTSAGLYVGHRLVHNRDFSRAEANVISLGTFAGSLLGGGTTILAGGGDRTATVLGFVGSAAGFWLTYSGYARDARDAAESGFRLSMNAAGLLHRPPAHSFDAPQAVPFAAATWTW
jgi:hypothetical protein